MYSTRSSRRKYHACPCLAPLSMPSRAIFAIASGLRRSSRPASAQSQITGSSSTLCITRRGLFCLFGRIHFTSNNSSTFTPRARASLQAFSVRHVPRFLIADILCLEIPDSSDSFVKLSPFSAASNSNLLPLMCITSPPNNHFCGLFTQAL